MTSRERGMLFEGMSEEETKALDNKCNTSYLYLQKQLSQLLELTSFEVVRKIDLHLVLALFALFIFNILNRPNIASA